MKNICDWFTLNFYNLTAVARAKRVEPQGEMRWKLFGNIVLFLSSLFKEQGKDGMDCMWIKKQTKRKVHSLLIINHHTC